MVPLVRFAPRHGAPRGVRRVWFWQMAIDGTPNASEVNVPNVTIQIKARGF
jgi:hypothetical protein